MRTVHEALATLEDLESPDEIADHFEREGITGFRETCSMCPVAVYLRRETGEVWQVTSYDVWRETEPDSLEIETYELGSVVREFISRFDQDDYPALERMGGY